MSALGHKQKYSARVRLVRFAPEGGCHRETSSRPLSAQTGSRSIQLVIHAERQQLIALIDRFSRDGRERSRCIGKADARRAEIDVFVLTHDRPLAGQGMLDAPADCPTPSADI